MTLRLLIISLVVAGCAKPAPNTTPENHDSLAANFEVLVQEYEDPGRSNWQNPSLVISLLGDLNNKTVADIGTGTGYFTFPLAPKAEKVIAIDIEQKFLNYIEERKHELNDIEIASKIETRLAKENDPFLNSEEVNLALIVNTFNYLDNRPAYLQKVKAGLALEGEIVIVDYKKGDLPVGPAASNKIAYDSTIKELELAGFQINMVDTASLQFQYIIKGQKMN